jgi:hypothetical protein
MLSVVGMRFLPVFFGMGIWLQACVGPCAWCVHLGAWLCTPWRLVCTATRLSPVAA